MDLLPCPFCGGDAETENYITEAHAGCTKCGIGLVRRHAPREDTGIAEAARAWNTRALITAARRPEPLAPHAGDLWWDANDGESGYGDPYEAYEEIAGWTASEKPVELSRGQRLPHVWAVRITLTRDDAGDPDETEVQLFNTEAEAYRAMLSAAPKETT